MKQFIELPKSKLIVNTYAIKFIKLEWQKTDKWEIIYFNHTAMGTNNPKIEKEDYDYLNDTLMGYNSNLITD
jgi:hypothetical protein